MQKGVIALLHLIMEDVFIVISRSNSQCLIVTCLEFASRIGFDRKVSCLTYFYLTRFPTAKSEFQTRFETRSRYSHTPPETAVIVNRERINNLLRSIYVRSNCNPNTIIKSIDTAEQIADILTKPLGEKRVCFLQHQLMG